MSGTGQKTPTTNSWLNLKPGDHVRVLSHSGTSYEATIVYAGMDDAGLYVRLADGRLARLLPDRCNWKTLIRLGARDIVTTGDEIIVAIRGLEQRGRVQARLDDRVVLARSSKTEFTVPVKEAAERRMRLLFKTKSLRRGDEFIVKSRRGREIRGRVLNVERNRITARLRGPSRAPVEVHVDHLDLGTLFVLIPVLGSSPSWTDDAFENK